MLMTSSNQVKDYWNSFANLYGNELENIYLPAGISLSRMLNFSDKKNILEVGCGSGLLSLYWISQLQTGSNYTSVDLSDEMIKFAEKRKQTLKSKLNDVQHSFVCGNAENLDFIANESIDAYLGSLVIHLTPDPIKLLQEAKRVLKKGGKVGFSVLGKTEDSNFFSIIHNALKNNGVVITSNSSGGLVLNSRESLIKVLQENGFEVNFCWRELTTMDIFEENGLNKALGQPRIAKILSEVDPETRQKIESDVKNTFHEFKSKYIPLQAELFFVVGTKKE